MHSLYLLSLVEREKKEQWREIRATILIMHKPSLQLHPWVISFRPFKIHFPQPLCRWIWACADRTFPVWVIVPGADVQETLQGGGVGLACMCMVEVVQRNCLYFLFICFCLFRLSLSSQSLLFSPSPSISQSEQTRQMVRGERHTQCALGDSHVSPALISTDSRAPPLSPGTTGSGGSVPSSLILN